MRYIERELLGSKIRQNTETNMLNANDLLKVGNEIREKSGLSQKQLASFFNIDSTKELINAICLEENLPLDRVKMSKRGIDGGTWLHPILFVEMASWYSSSLRVHIVGWVVDCLASTRNENNDSFVAMCNALSDAFGDEFSSPLAYAEAANQVANACKVGNQSDKWQKATDAQLKLRDKIQSNAVILADVSPNVGSCINKAITKALAAV